jgi:hypothetical protein
MMFQNRNMFRVDLTLTKIRFRGSPILAWWRALSLGLLCFCACDAGRIEGPELFENEFRDTSSGHDTQTSVQITPSAPCTPSNADLRADASQECEDKCPTDANKSTPGVCGCGVSDEDQDADGVADCLDGCATDANKSTPGVCGCGAPDDLIDSDADSIFDCVDECPNDRFKSAPGTCGCSVIDSDSDGDGVIECETTLSYFASLANSPDIVVPSNYTIFIDQDIELGLIKVEGALKCIPDTQVKLQTEGILVVGPSAQLTCGSEFSPFTGKLELVLTGYRELSEILTNPPHTMGGKAIVAMGGATISLFGSADKAAYTRLDRTMANASSSAQILDERSWESGDDVVVSTTSFYQNQSEAFTLQSVESKKLIFDQSAQYSHYGDLQQFSDTADKEDYTLDERAYVANLTRNIVVKSTQDEHTNEQLGAHMMIMHNGKAYIDGVEFFRVGQMGQMGRYPFHWHRIGDASGQFIRNSSIHESYHRCVTIHGTDNAEVIGNTCYNHFGHGYFLEDGNERGNIIQHNLGMHSKKIDPDRALLVSDFTSQPGDRFPGPATYWISNPDNDVRHNVAVGSEGSGFWMSFMKEIYCDSSGCSKSPRAGAEVIRPLTTNTLHFSDNTAASTVCGVTWDGAADGDWTGNSINAQDLSLVSAHYLPQDIPTFDALVTYKSARAGIYFRGAQAHFPNSIFADNGTSAFFAYNQVLKNTIMVGISANHSDAERDYHFDTGIDTHARHKRAFEGVRVYDGPFVLDNVFFANFSDVQLLRNGQRDITPTPIVLTGGAQRFVNSVKHVTFEPEPYRRLYLNLNEVAQNWQDSYIAAIADVDGQLTGAAAGSLILPNHSMNWLDGVCSPVLSSGGGDQHAIACAYDISYLRIDNGRNILQNFDVDRVLGEEVVSVDHEPSAQSNFLSKFSMIMDQDLGYRLRNFDLNQSTSIELRFTSQNVGNISPIVEVDLESVIDNGCQDQAPWRLVKRNGNNAYDCSGDLRPLTCLGQANTTAYALAPASSGSGQSFYFRIESTNTRPSITAEEFQGIHDLHLRCD